MLLRRLKASVEGMGLKQLKFGYPEMVIKEVQKAESLFKDFSKAKPSTLDAYNAALRLLSGEKLDDWSIDLVAAAICIPIKEQRDRTVLESEYCDELLCKYENDAYEGDLWRLTWYSLLNSYLTYDLARTSTEAGMAGFSKLRRLLNRTWPYIDKQSGAIVVPDWVRILREENQLLSDNPVEKYARDYLAGNTNHIKVLAENLGIPARSWFWQELVLGAVRHATVGNDEEFRSQILMLIELVKTAPVYRDKSIAEILNRFYKCSSRTVHPELRDFVINASIWKNPKLKAAGIATAWNQVSEPVWQMVMGWVNERNLRDFFDILATRRHSDHGRLKFWSRYMNQISWTRLVFGSETIWQKNHNAGIRTLLESEEGTYATLEGAPDKELDAFLMQIGEYIFVEFSKTGNGAYIYRAADTPFDLHTNAYSGSTSDLKRGHYGYGVAKIIHIQGWEYRAENELRKLGIFPDQNVAKQELAKHKLSDAQHAALQKIEQLNQQQSENGSNFFRVQHYADEEPSTIDGITVGGSKPVNTVIDSSHGVLTLKVVRSIISQYEGASASEQKVYQTRRIWVFNPNQNAELEKDLKNLGFCWSKIRNGWYWTED